MTYCGYPGTTAIYIRNAMRRAGIEITTVGECCDIDTGRNNPYPRIGELIQKDPDYRFILEVESGGFELDWVPRIEDGITGISKLWYAIDTHVAGIHHVNRAKHYGLVFVAQRQFTPIFRDTVTTWLPLACDPEFHKGDLNCKKEYDVTFVGNYANGVHNKRTELLTALAHNCKLNVKKNLWYRDVTSEYEKSYIVFNRSLAGDLNMRVYEELASGAMVITDRVDENGGSEFFQDGTHIKYYRSENELIDITRFYLSHSAQRNVIAAAGQEEVLRKHTYDNRVNEIIIPTLKNQCCINI